MILWFETHATSLDNEAGLASGHYDVELSATGRQQALELGARHPVIDAVYTSDLCRARDTAQLAFPHVTAVVDPRLRELDYGALTRHPKREIDAVRGQYIDAPFPGGESYAQACTRVAAVVAELRQRHPADAVVVMIGHRATQHGLDVTLRGLPVAEAVLVPWTWQPGWRYSLV